MTTLTDFLAARLDEDQEAAENASQDPDEGNVWTVGARRREFKQEARIGDDRDDLVFDIKDGVCVGFDELLAYLTRYHPKRALREVTAKRAILALDLPPVSCDQAHPQYDVYHPAGHGPHPVYLALAQAYSDHPDYRQEWDA